MLNTEVVADSVSGCSREGEGSSEQQESIGPATRGKDISVLESDVTRFWLYVDRKSDGECWLWRGHTTKRGYGWMHIGKQAQSVLSHRVSYKIAHPRSCIAGTCICHQCDNPPCVNPNHLLRGSHKENMQDMMIKGRSAWGERGSKHKLTITQIRKLMSERSIGIGVPELARRYEVCESHVYSILRGRFWKNLHRSEHVGSV